MNNVQLIGRLTRDVEITSTPNGIVVAKFALAVDKGLSKDKRTEYEAQGKPTADFINCLMFGDRTEILCRYAGKGNRIGVVGQITTGKYEDHDGKMVYTTNVLVRDFDIIDFKDEERETGIPKFSKNNSKSNDIPF